MSLQSEIWTAELIQRAKDKCSEKDIPRWIELPKQEIKDDT